MKAVMLGFGPEKYQAQRWGTDRKEKLHPQKRPLTSSLRDLGQAGQEGAAPALEKRE